MARKREPRLLNSVVLNAPETKQEQEDYDKMVFKALATALYRALEPKELDALIENLRQAQ